MKIRPITDPKSDYQTIAPMISELVGAAVSAESLYEQVHVMHKAKTPPLEFAAEMDGTLIGTALWLATADGHEGEYSLSVIVSREHRGQGTGTALYNHLMNAVADQEIKTIHSSLKDNDSDALRWAQNRGFEIRRHIFDSKLDLSTFDPAPFGLYFQKAADQGIRITSLAELGNTPKVRRKLYVVNKQVSLDNPASLGNFPEFEVFDQILSPESSWYMPETQFIAVDGDEFVGIGPLGYEKNGNYFINIMTGVMPQHRGRGIAHALKLHSIKFAQSFGAEYIYTSNDSENAPMLAINRKLGYQPMPGSYRLVKKLKE